MSVANDDNDDSQVTKSFIGIAVAIGGNVLISLALNCQKLAHKRLELERQAQVEDGDSARGDDANEIADEMRPLMEGNEGNDPYTTPTKPRPKLRLPIPRILRSPQPPSGLSQRSIIAGVEFDDTQAVAIDVGDEDSGENAAWKPIQVQTDEEEEEHKTKNNEAAYLRSKLWWFGFLLMNIGEIGNFLSYAYAPASIVAPLGTVALIANCLFAPIMLKEKLRKRDLLGVVLAIFGTITIVGAGKQSDVRLDHAGLIKAITQKPFIIYAITCTALIVLFAIISGGPVGRKWVFVDVVLCALFGGFTVLATKAVSTLLSLHWIEIFKDPITYPVVAILCITGVGQIRYLNRALMNFDSKVVIPTFFVSFNLSAIIGSAILYGDFKDVQIHQLTSFLYGIATTFAGVFFLTRSTIQSGRELDQPVIDPNEGNDGTENSQQGSSQPLLVPTSRGVALRNKKSSASLALSPGKYLLLAASPPRDDRPPNTGRNNGPSAESPASLSRRRIQAP